VRLSKYLLAQGDLDGACAALNEAAPTFSQNPVYLNELIDNSTIAAVALNQFEQAALLQGYIDAWLVANDFVRPPLRKQEIAPSLEKLRASLSKKAFTQSYSQGQMLTLTQAIALVQKVVSQPVSVPALSSCESTA
jgi:hypothetical protein